MDRKHTFPCEDQVVALVLLAVTAGYWFGAYSLSSLRSDDIVGPAGFPMLVALAGALLSGWLLVKPERGDVTESLGGMVWIYWLLFLVYAAVLPWVGFGIGTVFFLAGSFIVLRAPPMRAVLTALVVTAVLWIIFARLLGVRLPLMPWA